MPKLIAEVKTETRFYFITESGNNRYFIREYTEMGRITDISDLSELKKGDRLTVQFVATGFRTCKKNLEEYTTPPIKEIEIYD